MNPEYFVTLAVEFHAQRARLSERGRRAYKNRRPPFLEPSAEEFEVLLAKEKKRVMREEPRLRGHILNTTVWADSGDGRRHEKTFTWQIADERHP